MANRFQKFIFNLSTMSPCAFLLVIMTWIQMDIPPIIDVTTKKIQMSSGQWVLIIALVVLFLLSFYSVFFLKICKKRMGVVRISVAEIAGYDTWGIAVVLSYAVPIAGIAVKDYSPWITIIVIFFLLSITVISNVVIPSPLLLIKGYHFYKFKNTDGGGEYTLISQRTSINSGKSIKEAVCAFEYLFIAMSKTRGKNRELVGGGKTQQIWQQSRQQKQTQLCGCAVICRNCEVKWLCAKLLCRDKSDCCGKEPQRAQRIAPECGPAY